MSNKNLNNAKKEKNDEFYTDLKDIREQVEIFREEFKNKIIYLSADNPQFSNFYIYLKDNFKDLELKKIITTYYSSKEKVFKTEFNGIEKKTELKQNGDFRSEECIDILKECDIVFTNPPFSLFSEYINILNNYNKKYIIMGHQASFSIKYIFSLLKDNKIFVNGCFNKYIFKTDKGEFIEFNNICWFNNIKNIKERDLILSENFIKEVYDCYDAINFNKIKDIPKNYNGKIGVPITIIKYNYQDSFEILDLIQPKINGKNIFKRIIIKRK